MLDALSGPIDAANAEVIGESLVALDGDRGVVRVRGGQAGRREGMWRRASAEGGRLAAVEASYNR